MAWARGVVAVHRALHLDHHAACVGQQGEVVHARDGAGELRQHRPGGLQQRGVLVGRALHGGGADHIEGQWLRRLVPVGQATLPRAHDPGLDGQKAVGPGHRRLQAGRSGQVIAVFLPHGRATGLQIRQQRSSPGRTFATDAPGLAASWRRGLWPPAEQRAARLGDQVLALGGRWRGNGKHGDSRRGGLRRSSQATRHARHSAGCAVGRAGLTGSAHDAAGVRCNMFHFENIPCRLWKNEGCP